MEKRILESIIRDNKAIKFGKWNGRYFIFESKNLVIRFF
jgi:hypothetical protein